MFYMPATTLAMPMVVQETKPVPVTTTTTNYYMVPQTTIYPTMPLLHTTLAYPAYGLLTKTVEKSPPVQHVIHHYTQPRPQNDCCELCCPWRNESPRRQSRSRSRSRSISPPRNDREHYSRRVQYDTDIDEKIKRIQLDLSVTLKRDKSTETVDYYRRPSSPRPIAYEKSTMTYTQCDEPPKRRPRSTSRHRTPSLPREPWRSSNQNEYPWRDAHLPAYRSASENRSKPNDCHYYSDEETAHKRSHSNLAKQSNTICNNNYIYRPKSEVESRKHYIQTTGKNPDHEVYQSLHPTTTTIYNSSGSAYDIKQCRKVDHSFYSDVSTCYAPKLVDLTPNYNSRSNTDPSIHIVPKHNSGTLEPPYLKIYNAPVTYLH